VVIRIVTLIFKVTHVAVHHMKAWEK